MITEKIQFSDTEWLEDLEKGATLAEQLADNLEGLGDVGEENFKQLTSIIGKYEDSLGKVSDKVKTLESDTKRNERVQSNLQKTLKNSIRNTSIFGTTIGDIQDKFGGLTKGMGKSIRSLGTFRGAFSALTKVLIASPLGLILGLVAGIAAALQRNQKFIDRFQQAWAGVNAVFDVLLDRLANVGSVITALFDGGFAAAGKELKNIFAGVGDEIEREIKLAQQLTKVLQQVERTEINLNIQRSASNATLKELNKTIEDTTKSTSDRIAAAQQFNDIETKLVNEEVANQERRVAALLGFAEVTDEVRENIARIGREGVTLDELGISSSTVSDAREFEQEISKLFDLQTRSFEVQTTNQNKLNSLRKEEADRVRALREQYNDLLATLNEKFIKAQLDSLSASERVRAEFEIARKEVLDLKDALIELTTSAEQVDEIEVKFKAVLDQLDLEETQALDSIELPLDKLPPQEVSFEEIKISTDDQRDFEQEFKDLGLRAGEGLGRAIGEGFDKESLSLEAKVAQFQQLAQNIANVVSSVIENLSAQTEAQIQQQNELIEASNERIGTLEDQLDDEKGLKEQGLANNYELLKQQLDQEYQQRNEQEQRLFELREKANEQKRVQARVQAAVDAATQISNITTAISGIIADSGKFGLVGIALAVAGVAALLGFWAKWKATAKQAAEVPEFGEGGQLKNGLQFGQKMKPGLVKGPSHSKGGVNVVDKKGQLYNIEGDEFMTKASITKRYHPILEAMNNDEGGFGGISFDEMLSGSYETPGLNIARNPIAESKSIREGQESLQETRIWRQSEDFKSALGEYMPALIQSNKNVEHAVRSRPNYISTKDGYVREIDTGYGIHRSKYKEL